MKKLSIVVKLLSIFSLVLGFPVVVLGIYFDITKNYLGYFELVEFCLLMIMILTMVLGGCFEGLIGENKAYELSKFTPLNIIFYSIFFAISAYMIIRDNILTTIISAGIINAYKLLELSHNYIQQFGKNTGNDSMHSN